MAHRLQSAHPDMGETTDTEALINALNKALPLLARDAVAAAVSAGTIPGPEGIALGRHLRRIAANELEDLERLAARIASLGGSPALTVAKLEPPAKLAGALKWLATMQREANDAVVAAIPADADDAEGEATEHLLEHVVDRKREAIELLERALR